MAVPVSDDDIVDAAGVSGDLSGLSVCVVACHYQPETTGSAPYNTEMVRALTAAGADVELVVGVPHYPRWEVTDPRYRRGLRWREHDAGARITRLRHLVPKRANLAGRARLEASFLALATPHVAASRADVIVTVTPLVSALTAARAGARGRPVGAIVHDLTGNGASQSGTAGNRVGSAISVAEYRLLTGATRVAVITPRFRDALRAGGVPEEKIVDLPLFTHVERADVDRHEARRRLGWPERSIVAVHTGNMGMKQGLETLVDAAALADRAGDDIEFVIVGDGNRKQALLERGASIERLRFVDPVDQADYPYVLAAADILLLNEKPGVLEMSLPSKLTSYSSAGRPIVASVEEGGITHSLLASADAAALVDCGDPAALLAEIHRVAADEVRSKDLVERAAELQRSHFDRAVGVRAFSDFVGGLAATR